MKKMTAEQARSTNGGYTTWACTRCGRWFVSSIDRWDRHGLTYIPLRCPHCRWVVKWRRV